MHTNFQSGNLKGRDHLVGPRHKQKDNEDDITMGLEEVGCNDLDWIHLAQDMDQW
jgi:hypothetical protein